MNTTQHLRCALAALGLLLAGAADAHHSFAMFDASRTVTISGTLYAAEFTNPHGWIWIAVMNDKGQEEKWGLEGGSVADLRRLGYTKSTLKVGTKVKATLHPLKDGRSGGQLVSLDFGDGKKTGG